MLLTDDGNVEFHELNQYRCPSFNLLYRCLSGACKLDRVDAGIGSMAILLLGRRVAERGTRDEIASYTLENKLISFFITAGMGGGTGTGAATDCGRNS